MSKYNYIVFLHFYKNDFMLSCMEVQLADSVNVSTRTIISIEKEQYNPSLMLAYRIARLFEVTIEDLCCLKENYEMEEEKKMIKDKRGFITGIVSALFAIACIAVFGETKETKYLVCFLILTAYAAISFIKAFTRRGGMEDIQKQADERDLYVTMKSSHLVIKIMNYGIFVLTMLALLLYTILNQSYFLVISGTLCGVLLLMIIVFLGVNICLEKKE